MLGECPVQQGYKGPGRGLGVQTTEDSFVNQAKALSSFFTLGLITWNHPRCGAELTFCLWSAMTVLLLVWQEAVLLKLTLTFGWCMQAVLPALRWNATPWHNLFIPYAQTIFSVTRINNLPKSKCMNQRTSKPLKVFLC